ncbi:hypothetical protein DEO72_LG7g1872 [Vigna unguiculata]|uniref:Uncharacterized protein n=1 Tax=Vigna unguiculata TaxID=3917 RepID=A0A4D6MJ05_VIGUN|nr:hypothetical protein DEO72_LG7g1872 [Vigna unguiculata]
MCRCETERQQMREEEDTICVEMMRKLWWLTQIYFRMGATPAISMADGAGRRTRGGREAGAGMNCASLWFSAAMDLCVWRVASTRWLPAWRWRLGFGRLKVMTWQHAIG